MDGRTAVSSGIIVAMQEILPDDPGAGSIADVNQRIDRREFGRLSLTVAAAMAGGCAAQPRAAPPSVPSTEIPIITNTGILNAGLAYFDGDYSTGDFSQWWVQCKNYNGNGNAFPGSYSASIVGDASFGRAARFEVRTGDVPPFGGGERSEVSGGSSSGGREGDVRWYRFATKFDQSFPDNHADLGWGLTNQWHGETLDGSPPISWSVSEQNGQWTLVAERQSRPADYLGTVVVFSTPLDAGSWHDVTMRIGWSVSESGGFVELWHNGVRQTFTDGSQTYRVRTLVPTAAPSVYYKEGYYRDNGIAPTGVVYHSGFRCAATQEAL